MADIERLRADNPTGVAEIVGGEALPQTVLERLMCTDAVTGVVFDGKGQPIWVGRTHRHATEAQVKAIIARDRHCTGKDWPPQAPERCEIHHIVPWEQGGLTDIDTMCLACPHVPSQHPRPRLHRHQNQDRLQNHQPQQPTQRPLNPTNFGRACKRADQPFQPDPPPPATRQPLSRNHPNRQQPPSLTRRVANTTLQLTNRSLEATEQHIRPVLP